jgi:prepilin-type N-terminal cleavage/methylation domain-containing protein
MNARAQGFTLVEILVVTLLSALIMGSIYQMVVMQDKTTRNQYAIVETNQNARTAIAILSADLKEISAVAGDVIAADSVSITFRALRKAGIACAAPGGAGTTLDVHELGAAFIAGDSVLVFAEGANASSALDDTWVISRLSNVAALTVVNCGGLNPFQATGWRRLTMNGAVLGTVTTGALVRSFNSTRYRLTNNGEWGQLLRQEATAPNWIATETAVLDRLATIEGGGLRFRYFNAAGNQIAYNTLNANLNNIMRVQVKVTGKSASSVGKTGSNRYTDSLVTTVYLRGNFRTQ